MSLKDRLNAQNSMLKVEEKQKQEPKYYPTSEISKQFASLGILDSLLEDENINSIFVNGAKNIYINKNNRIHKSTSTFRDSVQIENLIKKYAQNIAFEIDEKKPIISFNHELGVNIKATLPPLSDNPCIFVKCYREKFASLAVLQDEKAVSKEIALVLEALCAIKINILIIGDRNTLKTTLLSSLAKKVPINNTVVLVDNSSELKIENDNILNFDFSLIDTNEKKELYESIFSSHQDKIFINDIDDNDLSFVLSKFLSYKGAIMTYSASSINSAFDKIADILSKEKNIEKNHAQELIKQVFDIVIFVKNNEISKRKIASISQIKKEAEGIQTEDIFYLNDFDEHKSNSIVPGFFEEIKMNSLPIGDNIFDESYKHTYPVKPSDDILNRYGKKNNIDILKKFKKDLPAKNDADQLKKEEVENKLEQVQEEIIKQYKADFGENKNNEDNSEQV